MFAIRSCRNLVGYSSSNLSTTCLQSIPLPTARNMLQCYAPIINPLLSVNKPNKLVQFNNHLDALKQYYCHAKKAELQLRAAQSKEFIKDALEQRKELLLEKKAIFVQDIRDKKARVKERMEEIVERENVLTIPNLLCVTRGLMAPYLGYVIINGDFTLGMGILAFAGLTDLLDGYIARNWKSQASKMGSFLDPMADKLLVGSLVISLTYCNLFPLWLSGFVLFRDVFLIGAGFVIRYISLPPPKTLSRYFDVTHATAQLEPTFISKVNTVVQLVAIATSLGAPIWGYIDHPALYGLWYFTGLTTAAAALSYIISKDTYKIIKETRRLNNQIRSSNNA